VVYYAIIWLDSQGAILRGDESFALEEEDIEKLDKMSIVRRNYMDEYRISKMLKRILFRTKPL
jgi:hypothetical protein